MLGVRLGRQRGDVPVRDRALSLTLLGKTRGPWWRCQEGIVLMVKNDPDAVEADLAAGRLQCSRCCVGALARWGFARPRVLRDGLLLRPRRGICSCGATHVLLPDVCLARRRDAVEVIGSALSAGLAEGYERVADRLGVPPDTVRGWLRRFRRWAEAIRGHFTRWLVALEPGRRVPEPAGSAAADAVEAIMVAARAASLRLGTRLPWSWASALTAGGLLANTSSSWPAPE